MAGYNRKPGRLKVNTAGDLPELPPDPTLEPLHFWWEEARIVLNRQREEAEDAAEPVVTDFESAVTWTHTHGLGRYPIIQVLDDSGNLISLNDAAIQHLSVNEVEVTHGLATAGTIILY